MLRLVSSAIIAGFFAHSLNASPPGLVPRDPGTLPGQRAAHAPVIDGTLAEGEWPEKGHGEGFTDKDTGNPSDEKGEFWLCYDDKFVYFAGRAWTDPKRVVADEYRQNVDLSGNDAFHLAVDGLNSGQDIDLFSMNAQGATGLRLSGGRAAKTEWLGEFEAVGKKTETGWQVEARIPWSLVRLPAPGVRDMVFNVLWYRSNKSNTYEWVFTRDDFKNFPHWTGVDVPQVSNQRSVKLLPYFYAGIDDDNRHIANAGLDLKTELSSDLTLVGTANPDFRNIENNILSLDHSYFERLADDARPFFQEGSRFRSFGFDQRIYASQRIHDFDTGLNLYGTLGGGTQLGLISTIDFGNQSTFAGSLGHRFDATKTLDLAYVRNEQEGARSDAFNLFYDQRVGEYDLFLTTQMTNDEVAKTGSRIDTGIFRQNGGVNMSFEFIQVTPDFFPRLGFSPEQDLRGFSASYGREIQPKSGPVQGWVYQGSANSFTHLDGSAYRQSVTAEAGAQLRSDYSVQLAAEVSKFEGSNDHIVMLQLARPISNPYRAVSFSVASGRFGGEDYRSYGFNLRYKPVKRMQVMARSQWVDFHGFDNQVVLSANYDIGRYEAVGGRLVRQGDDWNWYLSYRLSGKRGNEFFLILGDPNSPTFRHSLILKAVIPVSVRY
ncbi:MAG: hypothetical protein JSS66_13890 [Armatimonadetes bacterium]|nr:hypothetical protein [Armatimonadota bacterium]